MAQADKKLENVHYRAKQTSPMFFLRKIRYGEQVCAWLVIFFLNAWNRKENKILGQITATEIDEQKQFWVRRGENRCRERVEG